MFENPGDTLKIFAKIFFVLGVIFSVIMFFVLLFAEQFILAVIYLVLMLLGSWISALSTYCAGEAAEAARTAAHYSEEIAKYINHKEDAKEKEKRSSVTEPTAWMPEGKIPAWQRVEMEKAEAERKAAEETEQ